MSFAELGLSDEVLKAIEESGYTTPTQIQEQAIPLVIEGRDVIGASQTGTGKTAAFALPVHHQAPELTAPPAVPHPRAHPRARGTRSTTVLPGLREGHRPAAYCPRPRRRRLRAADRIDQLKAGADVVVATPGRLLDHMFFRSNMRHRRTSPSSSSTRSDRMLDMGFLPDVKPDHRADAPGTSARPSSSPPPCPPPSRPSRSGASTIPSRSKSPAAKSPTPSPTPSIPSP